VFQEPSKKPPHGSGRLSAVFDQIPMPVLFVAVFAAAIALAFLVRVLVG
jgi:hypothetical protein